MGTFEPCVCGANCFEAQGFGIDFCTSCGLGRPGALTCETNAWCGDRALPRQFYTRRKRFKKYLFRAMRRQSANTVPQETWEYLLQRRPYRGARHVQRTLKAARNLKRKCYDSLALMTSVLCPHLKVPCLGEDEKNRALQLFDQVDVALGEGGFVSYLFCLEYILRYMGRDDICVYINQIQCAKRRANYKERLDKIFGVRGARSAKASVVLELQLVHSVNATEAL